MKVGKDHAAAAARVALPGHRAPAAGWDEPFAMLDACHERVRRMLALLKRLHAHLRAQGLDAAARAAAADVLRYFDEAAPRHHEDEERHVLPRLEAGDDAALARLAARLRAEHQALHAAWAQLRVWLQALVAHGGDASPQALPADWLDAARSAQIGAFVAQYQAHAQAEDELAFPAARAGLDATALAAIGAEMAARRGL